MPVQPQNPFEVTKASHLTDGQIHSYWVDLPGGGHSELGNPTSHMPMLIRGGKGSGKTHLMRYYSFALQKLRAGASGDLAQTVKSEGYVGVYFKCSGLNAGRFAGKGSTPDVWRSIFCYYFEIWLAEQTLSVLRELTFGSATNGRPELESQIAREIANCFDRADRGVDSFSALTAFLSNARRSIDLAVNNASIRGSLVAEVLLTPGALIFALPKIFWNHFPSLSGTLVLYLIDEFENFSDEQQRFVNTLIRETEPPCTFKIGGRHYGFKTYRTLSDDEENKEGSEFEVLSLDNTLREKPEYNAFAARLCLRRLAQHGYTVPPTDDTENAREYLRKAFEIPDESTELSELTFGLTHLQRLRQQLQDGLKNDCSPGLANSDVIDDIIEAISVPGQPILEKVNILALYQRWARGKSILESAAEIGRACARYRESPSAAEEYRELLAHFKGDLLAQLRREVGRERGQSYLGIDCFIEMSEGLPRNLLTILKHIFKWAVFYGEEPFRSSKVSVRSQTAGVREAAEWFFNDTRGPGPEGQAVRTGVSRIARLFREIRFSDKPVECSLCTFSIDYDACPPAVKKVVDLSEQWSLFIQVPAGQKDRNKLRVDRKYQINGMLSPHWDLPTSRRGALPISTEHLSIVFAEDPAAFEQFVKNRVEPMRAPCFGRQSKTRKRKIQGQGSLLEEF